MINLLLILTIFSAIPAIAQYHARYSLLAARSIMQPDNPVNWEKVDTTTVSTEFVIALSTVDVHTNGKLAYVRVQTYRSNMPGTEGQEERALIDFENRVFYDLNKKIAYPLAQHDVVSKSDKKVEEILLQNEGKTSTIVLDKKVPSQLCYLIPTVSPLPKGIRSLVTPTQKISIQEWQKEAYNFNPIRQEALQCTPSGKVRDLLFL